MRSHTGRSSIKKALLGSLILLFMVISIRYMAQDYVKKSSLAVNPTRKEETVINEYAKEAPKSSSTHLRRRHAYRKKIIKVNPCDRKSSIEMADLMELDFKNYHVYIKNLLALFDHLDRSVDDYMNFFADGGEREDIDCKPIQGEISKIEYMISQRDGRDSQVRNIVLMRYKKVAYRILDQTMNTKREYRSMVAVSGIFMNLRGKHFFSSDQEKELAHIHERILDDNRSFDFQKEQKEMIDKNGLADRILLRDWLGALD